MFLARSFPLQFGWQCADSACSCEGGWCHSTRLSAIVNVSPTQAALFVMTSVKMLQALCLTLPGLHSRSLFVTLQTFLPERILPALLTVLEQAHPAFEITFWTISCQVPLITGALEPGSRICLAHRSKTQVSFRGSRYHRLAAASA